MQNTFSEACKSWTSCRRRVRSSLNKENKPFLYYILMTNNMTISVFLYCLSLGIVCFKMKQIAGLTGWVSLTGKGARRVKYYRSPPARAEGGRLVSWLMEHLIMFEELLSRVMWLHTLGTNEALLTNKLTPQMKSGEDTKQQRTRNLTSLYTSH